MNILVTSGGTSEKIDQVRKITNMSTGRLGSLIADAFAQQGHRVVYVHGEGACMPANKMDKAVEAGSVEQLGRVLETLLTAETFDCVIHAMAISDYGLQSVLTASQMAEGLAGALRRFGGDAFSDEALTRALQQAITELPGMEAHGKFSSDYDHMVLVLKKTPKLIQKIKEWQPDTLLVGFKLLVDVEQERLEQVARQLQARSGCDLVLANDLSEISGDSHKALLIDAAGRVAAMSTKQEIALQMVERVTAMKEGK